MTCPLQIFMHWKTKRTSTWECDLSCLWLLWHVISMLTGLNKIILKLCPIQSYQRKNNLHLLSYIESTFLVLFLQFWLENVSCSQNLLSTIHLYFLEVHLWASNRYPMWCMDRNTCEWCCTTVMQIDALQFIIHIIWRHCELVFNGLCYV